MTDAIRCPICARREPADGATVCGICLGRIDDDLARIPELCDWAATQIAGSTAANMAGSGIAAHKIPIDAAAIDAATGLASQRLEYWERLTREHFGYTPWPPLRTDDNRLVAALRRSRGVIDPEWSVKGCVGFLRAQLALIAERADYPIEEFAGDVHAIRWGVKADTDLGILGETGLERFAQDADEQKPGTRIKCPADHPDADGRLCGAWLIVDAARPADLVICHRCRTDWTAERLVLVAQAVPSAEPIWSTAEPLCRFLKIHARTLHGWVKAGDVTRRWTPDGWIYDVHQAATRNRTSIDVTGT